MRKICLVWIATLLSGWLATVSAAESTDPYDDFRPDIDSSRGMEFDESLIKKWQEQGTEVPGMPSGDALQAVTLDSLGEDFQLFLDPDGVLMGEDDRVLRYWLIVKSRAGAINATYEGLRCDTREYKFFAFGSPKRPGQPRLTKNADWRAIDVSASNAFRAELADDVLCSGPRPRSLDKIKDGIKGRYAQLNPFGEFIDF